MFVLEITAKWPLIYYTATHQPARSPPEGLISRIFFERGFVITCRLCPGKREA